jgi:hypothetical protein
MLVSMRSDTRWPAADILQELNKAEKRSSFAIEASLPVRLE